MGVARKRGLWAKGLVFLYLAVLYRFLIVSPPFLPCLYILTLIINFPLFFPSFGQTFFAG